MKARSKERRIPTISIDDCFPSQGDEEPIKVLPMRDSKSGALRGMLVPSKGPGEAGTVERIIKVIDNSWGRKDIVLKSDKEAAIVSLKEKIKNFENTERLLRRHLEETAGPTGRHKRR